MCRYQLKEEFSCGAVSSGSGVVTAVAWVAVVAQVQSWPRNFHMPWAQPKKKKNMKNTSRETTFMLWES